MDWQDKFNDFDTDCSGSIDLEEMREALKSFGYNLSPHLIMLVQRKYSECLIPVWLHSFSPCVP
jgi:Ca2+-binding EF-hand superfamily protein